MMIIIISTAQGLKGSHHSGFFSEQGIVKVKTTQKELHSGTNYNSLNYTT
jgi:hypothetical protein